MQSSTALRILALLSLGTAVVAESLSGRIQVFDDNNGGDDDYKENPHCRGEKMGEFEHNLVGMTACIVTEGGKCVNFADADLNGDYYCNVLAYGDGACQDNVGNYGPPITGGSMGFGEFNSIMISCEDENQEEDEEEDEEPDTPGASSTPVPARI